MRKDVECTFGILKGRWRILKAGVRLHGVNAADNVWLTCCALHNMLLEVDGLLLEWDGELGLHDIEDGTVNLLFALSRFESGTARRQYDTSGIGPGFVEEEDDFNNEDDQMIYQERAQEAQEVASVSIHYNGENCVKISSCDLMREKLIIHFDILFQQNKIKWPRRQNRNT